MPKEGRAGKNQIRDHKIKQLVGLATWAGWGEGGWVPYPVLVEEGFARLGYTGAARC